MSKTGGDIWSVSKKIQSIIESSVDYPGSSDDIQTASNEASKTAIRCSERISRLLAEVRSVVSMASELELGEPKGLHSLEDLEASLSALDLAMEETASIVEEVMTAIHVMASDKEYDESLPRERGPETYKEKYGFESRKPRRGRGRSRLSESKRMRSVAEGKFEDDVDKFASAIGSYDRLENLISSGRIEDAIGLQPPGHKKDLIKAITAKLKKTDKKVRKSPKAEIEEIYRMMKTKAEEIYASGFPDIDTLHAVDEAIFKLFGSANTQDMTDFMTWFFDEYEKREGQSFNSWASDFWDSVANDELLPGISKSNNPWR